MDLNVWRTLSAAPEAKARLLAAGEGKLHLSGTAMRLLSGPAASRPDLLRLGLEVLTAAWESSPLDGGLAARLLDMDRRLPFLGPEAKKALIPVARRWNRPDDLGDLARLAEARDHPGLKDHLLHRRSDDPGNLFWLQHLVDLAFASADRELAGTLLGEAWPGDLAGAKAFLEGDHHFLGGDPERAAACWEKAGFSGLAGCRRAEALWRMGRHEEARGLWRAELERRPWRVNPLLRLHDLSAGLDRPLGLLPGRVAVLLYSYNKAQELDETLDALARSPLDNVRVFALDNGSCDGTSDVLETWRGRMPERFTPVPLPVNVGAPAARNWLLALPEVQDCEYAAFLDDDAIVPRDWQGSFHAALKALPEAQAYGARVVEWAAPGLIQHADLHLQAGTAEDGRGFRFDPVAACAEVVDLGQFAYLRPCLSVTGCFHLFRMQDLKAGGGFDIRFSPSQYDDLERDLRQALAGKPAAYQGHLVVGHKRRSGARTVEDRAARGSGRGNLVKLEAKYSSEDGRKLMAADVRRMEADWLRKARRLAADSG